MPLRAITPHLISFSLSVSIFCFDNLFVLFGFVIRVIMVCSLHGHWAIILIHKYLYWIQMKQIYAVIFVLRNGECWIMICFSTEKSAAFDHIVERLNIFTKWYLFLEKEFPLTVNQICLIIPFSAPTHQFRAVESIIRSHKFIKLFAWI